MVRQSPISRSNKLTDLSSITGCKQTTQESLQLSYDLSPVNGKNQTTPQNYWEVTTFKFQSCLPFPQNDSLQIQQHCSILMTMRTR